MGMENDTATLEKVWRFLINEKIYLAYNSATLLFGIYPSEIKKIYVHTKPLYECLTTQIFPAGEWINFGTSMQ